MKSKFHLFRFRFQRPKPIRDIFSNNGIPKLNWPDNDGFIIDRDTKRSVS